MQRCLSALQELGGTPILTHYSFCTNGSHYAGELGIPTVGYGPSPEALAHTIDEYVLVDQLTKRLRQDGYALVSGPRTTGDGYYESCVVGIEGNLIELTE